MCEECTAYAERQEKHLRRIADILDAQNREVPTLNLAAMGIYPSERMTTMALLTSITVTAAAGTTAVPQTFAEVGRADIVSEIINPRSLHMLPGMPVNGYPVIKDVSIAARVTAGTLVTPFSLVGFLVYHDNSGRKHIVGSLGMSVATALIATDSTLSRGQASFQNIIIPATGLGENAPSKFGTWAIEGTLALGTATTIIFDVYANIGVLYGVPK